MHIQYNERSNSASHPFAVSGGLRAFRTRAEANTRLLLRHALLHVEITGESFAMKKFRSTTLYLIIICVFLLVVNISLGFVLINQSSRAMRTLIESRMLDVSNTAAAMLDGDTLKTLKAEDKETLEYQEVLNTLTRFYDNIELEYIYCIRDLGNGRFAFMIDTDRVSPGAFGTSIAPTDALCQASQGTAAVDKKPYQDQWGVFYSAYSPVFDSQNEVAGIVAVDFSAKWYEDQISSQVRTTLLVSGISLFFASVIIIIIAARFRNRFRQMLSEMNVVSDGIETLVWELSPGITIRPHSAEEEIQYSDEITELGNKIRLLEHQLSEQIAFVQSQAYIDGLTGLGNRTAYEEYVNQLETKIKAGHAAFSVALFDLNGLKNINDLHGHEAGDRAIVEVASALKQSFSGAKLYRIGGDEFVVIQEGNDSDFPSRLQEVERILGETKEVSTAKGYSVFTLAIDSGYREVFRRADNAMYDDKKRYYLTYNSVRQHRSV